MVTSLSVSAPHSGLRTPRQSSMMKVMVMMTMLLMWTMTTTRGAGFRLTEVSGQVMKSVSVGPGGVWAVSQDDHIYYRNNTYRTNGAMGSDWIKVEGGLKQLDVGNDVVWGVANNDMIYIRTGISSANPQGTAWRNIPGGLKHISVSPAGYVWGVNVDDKIYIRAGASNANHVGDSWKQMYGSLKQVSVGVSGVWGVDKENNVFYRENTYGDYDPEGTKWIYVPDMQMTYVSVVFGNVFGINGGNLFVRKRVSFNNPTGTHWKPIGPASGGLALLHVLGQE